MGGTKIVGCLIAFLLLASCAGLAGKRTVRVGAKNFTEQDILGEIIAQHVEHRLQVPVERRFHLGGTLLAHESLRTGQIDLYPEYTGTALSAVLKEEVARDKVLARVRTVYQQQFRIEWLDPLGVDNGFAMVVRAADARQSSLETLSQAIARTWLLGVGYEFEQRPDGLRALDRTYSFRWGARPRSMDLGLLYQALQQGQVSMIAANATDGLLSSLDVKVLKDDKGAFPPYEVAIAVRQEAIDRVPGLRPALSELSGKLNNATMQQLNFEVDARHRAPAIVAEEFLRRAGLR